MEHHFSTAIFIFTRTPAEEVRVKKILCQRAGSAADEKLYKLFLHHNKKQAKASGLDFFMVSSEYQRGNVFGERLYHAFADLFRAGYERVIAIGNDTLSLDSETIQTAARHLQQKDVVLGPATDGGVYLIGLSEKAFHQSNFKHLAWQSSELLHSFCKQIQQASLSLHLLSVLSDIDSEKDLQRYLSQILPNLKKWHLILQIRSLLNFRLIFLILTSLEEKQQIFLFTLNLRGPPFLSHP